MPGFVEEDRHAVRPTGLSVQHKAIRYNGFRNGVVRSAGVSAEAFGVSDSREKYDRVAAQLNVGLQGGSLLIGQRRI